MNIWEAESDKPAKLTQKDIELAEKTFGVTLPQSYLKVLMEQNGGYLKTDAVHVDFVNEDGEGLILLGSLYGIKPNEGIMETEYLREEWGITKDKIILIAGDGHSFVAFDYEDSSTSPKVIYIDTERDEVHLVAESFDTLLSLMYTQEYEEEERDDIHVPTHEEIRELASSSNINDMSKGVYLWIHSFPMSKKDDLLYQAIAKVFHEGTEYQKINIATSVSNEIIQNDITSKDFIDMFLSLLGKEENLDLVINRETIEEHIAENK